MIKLKVRLKDGSLASDSYVKKDTKPIKVNMYKEALRYAKLSEKEEEEKVKKKVREFKIIIRY